WAGGLFPLRRIARRSAGLMAPSQLAPFLEKIISVFSKWAVTCVMVIILTGMINASVYLDWQSPLGFPYGKVLLSKLILVGAVLSLGGVSQFYILPSFRKIRDGAAMNVSDLERQFFYAITIEIGFVIATLILAALLTQTPPPHLGR
ncbi:MAG: CopD family protein, partial [Nitrospiria bacterium]